MCLIDQIGAIFAVNLTDGSRTILSNATTPNNLQPEAGSFADVSIDPVNENIAYVVDSYPRSLQRLDLTTGVRTLISYEEQPNSGIDLASPKGVLIDAANNRAIVADMTYNRLTAIDLTTGVRSLVSDVSNCLVDIATDNIQSHIYIADCDDGISRLDMATKTMTNVVNPPYVSRTSVFMDIDPDIAYALFLDQGNQSVFAVDLLSQEYVLLSKSIEE